MARSHTLYNLIDKKGRTLSDVPCEAYRVDTDAFVERQYTDTDGNAEFVALPDTVDCYILATWGNQVQRFYSEAPPGLGDLAGDLDDIDDGTTYGRVNVSDLTANRVDYDKMNDGTTYKRVLSAHLDAGKLKLTSSATYATGYDPSTKRRTFTSTPTTPYDVGDIWFDADNIKRCVTGKQSGVYEIAHWSFGTIDALRDGTTYERVLGTHLSAGKLKLTSAAVKDAEWYDEAGVEIDATHGINIYGTDNALTTRATKTGTIQCKVDTDGNISAGAGAVLLNSSGVTVKGDKAMFEDSDGVLRGWLYGSTSGWMQLYTNNCGLYIDSPGKNTYATADKWYFICPIYQATSTHINYISTTLPYTSDARDLGATDAYWRGTYTKFLCLSETATPTASTNFGKLYTKDDNKLYFQDGAGTEHEVAYV